MVDLRQKESTEPTDTEPISAAERSGRDSVIPCFNTAAHPWTRGCIVYWAAMWTSLFGCYLWLVATRDVWPLAIWCAFSTTAVTAMRG